LQEDQNILLDLMKSVFLSDPAEMIQ